MRMLALALAAAAADERHTLYDRKVLPPGWQLSSRAHPRQRISFIVALPQDQAGVEMLEERFWQVSDPKHPRYQEFMAVDEIVLAVTPKNTLHSPVRDWLEEYMPGALIESFGDALSVKGVTVGVAEQLFQTQLYEHVHNNGHRIIRCQGPYSVPARVGPSVVFVEGIADFPMHRSPSRRSPEAPQDVYVVPESLASMYQFKDTPAPKNSKQMPAEFQGDASFSPKDLDHFLKDNDLQNENVTKIVGPFNDQYPDTEATLDMQYMVGVSTGVTDWYWTSNGWMYTFATNLANYAEVPSTVSMSWGWSESQQCTVSTDCKTLGVDSRTYVARANTEFMKIGLRGVSVFASSGDSGANGRSDGGCTDPTLHAVFPASSPYVTSVGATQMETVTAYTTDSTLCKSQYKCVAAGTEEAVSVGVSAFTSGGGFSNYTARPSYQAKAVDAYLKATSIKFPPASMYNSKGRAFPDVASLGNNFLIYIESEGGWSPVGGTSASSPTWAGVAARLNDVSLAKTGKNLGFLNPLLYSIYDDHPEAFHDVIKGNNICTEDGCAPSCKGFKATKGWDAVTGMGTPDYALLVQHVGAILDARKSLLA